MQDSIFAEFQYFIKRINGYRSGKPLAPGETLDDLEKRFRLQVSRGLVIDEPHGQELAMEVLLSDLPEKDKAEHLARIRRTGDTDFELRRTQSRKLQGSQSKEQLMERALTMIHKALGQAGIRAQIQPLAVKMLHAAHELGDLDYTDPADLKLLFVKTLQLSGHAKKTDPVELAQIFNKVVSQYA